MTHPDTHPMTLYPDSHWRAVAPIGDDGRPILTDLGAIRTDTRASLYGEVWWRTGEVDEVARESFRHRWLADVGGHAVTLTTLALHRDDIAAILTEHIEARMQGEAP